MTIAYRASSTDRRYGLLLTVLVHAALLLGWQAMRTPAAPATMDDGTRTRILWIPLALPKPAPREPAPRQEQAPPRQDAAQPQAQPQAQPRPALPAPPAPIAIQSPSPAPAAASAPADSPATGADATRPSAKQMLERAKRDIGAIDKALRKENNPYIAAPLDSPQIRLRQGIEQAAAMAPNRLWEAPKVEELVNNTGDGARRSRVITGSGTYCLTERATNTDVEMIEHHGKLRITSCPQHETPATQQTWRTLRD